MQLAIRRSTGGRLFKFHFCVSGRPPLSAGAWSGRAKSSRSRVLLLYERSPPRIQPISPSVLFLVGGAPGHPELSVHRPLNDGAALVSGLRLGSSICRPCCFRGRSSVKPGAPRRWARSPSSSLYSLKKDGTSGPPFASRSIHRSLRWFSLFTVVLRSGAHATPR